MIRTGHFTGLALLALTTACNMPEAPDSSVTHNTLAYPITRTDDVSDTYFGQEVSDPYRWLEDDRAEEVERWVDDQNEVTQSVLDAIPYRGAIRARYEQLFNYEKVGIPRKIGGRYFISRNDGLQNQSVTYVRESLHGEESVFLDPNSLSDDGTVTASLGGASDDGRFVTEMRNEAGSDWQEIRVRDVKTGELLKDVLNWVKFSGASWVGDGFYYSRYPAPDGSEFSSENTFHSVYYHKIGTAQSEDPLVYRNSEEPNRYHFSYATEDNRFLVLNTSTGTDGNSLHIRDLENGGDWIEVVGGFDTRSNIVGYLNGLLLVLTDIDAPKYRLVGADPEAPNDRSRWTDVIAESEHLLEGVTTAGGDLFATHLRNACNAVTRYQADGSGAQEIVLPQATGSTGGFGGKVDASEVFYAFTSFTYPTSVYRYELASGESTLFYAPEVDFDPAAYESKQVFFPSKDGTKVPMFIVHKKGLVLDGQRPTMLYAYGGFNISLTPSFSTSNLILLEQGGVYAMPNLRGGGEFGEDWHEAGMLLNKQNVFDDFIAAGEYLKSAGYTSTERLAMAGGSNGGLLVGAVMAQQPDFAVVAFPAVGVMDMLRYHKFTIGWGWIPEYGCSDSSAVDFANLRGYSPLHNLKDGVAYPATMVTTADHDDRVVPAHSFKFAARLQAAHAGSAPVVIRIEKDAGHGAGKPTSKILDEQADKWAFMWASMGFDPAY